MHESPTSKMPTDTSYLVLESKRLIIDCLTTEDADDLYRYYSMTEVTRFQSWAPESVKDAMGIYPKLAYADYVKSQPKAEVRVLNC